MATRKIKDAKDLSTNELIYFKGHAQATYMSDGTTVEDAINNIDTGGSIDTSNFATKEEVTTIQEAIADIDTIRANAANYKGTVTSIRLDGVTQTPTNGAINLGYANKQASTFSGSTINLRPNQYTRCASTTLSTLTVTLGNVSNSNIINEYFVEFTTSSSGTTVSFPSTIKWANGTAPTFEAGCTYQVSIVNNLGTYIKFA